MSSPIIVRAHQHSSGAKGASQSGHRTLARRPNSQDPPRGPRLGMPGALRPLRGEAGDAPQAAGMPADVVIADTAYDADHVRLAIARRALAVIPNNPSRSSKHPLDADLYAQRHLVECCFSMLKQFRRVATRFEKTAANYLAVITIAAVVLCMR